MGIQARATGCLPITAKQPGVHFLFICERVARNGAVPPPPNRGGRRWWRRLLLINRDGARRWGRRPLLHLHLRCTCLLLLGGLRL